MRRAESFNALEAIALVMKRHAIVYFRQWKKTLQATFAEPLLYLLSFGIGMGSLIPNVETGGQIVSYRSFVFAGILAQSILYQSFFVAAYGGYSRAYQQKLFISIILSPISLSEVLWGEILWNAVRGTISPAAILLIGSISGDFSPLGALVALPLCLVGAIVFSATGLWVVALAQTHNDLSFAQFYLVFPMFLLCGVFFPIERLPDWMHGVAWLYPLTPILSLLRGLLLGLPLYPPAFVLIAFWTIVLVSLARRALLRRLVR